MKLAEIAERITAHLKRIEADGTGRLYQACAWPDARWVKVKYKGFWPASNLNRAQALRYLEWLDAGNTGKHWEALREERAS